nr:translation initiation factor IF-2-like [Pongo abelii]
MMGRVGPPAPWERTRSPGARHRARPPGGAALGSGGSTLPSGRTSGPQFPICRVAMTTAAITGCLGKALCERTPAIARAAGRGGPLLPRDPQEPTPLPGPGPRPRSRRAAAARAARPGWAGLHRGVRRTSSDWAGPGRPKPPPPPAPTHLPSGRRTPRAGRKCPAPPHSAGPARTSGTLWAPGGPHASVAVWGRGRERRRGLSPPCSSPRGLRPRVAFAYTLARIPPAPAERPGAGSGAAWGAEAGASEPPSRRRPCTAQVASGGPGLREMTAPSPRCPRPLRALQAPGGPRLELLPRSARESTPPPSWIPSSGCVRSDGHRPPGTAARRATSRPPRGGPSALDSACFPGASPGA